MSAALGASAPLPTLSSADLETAARIGWDEGLSTYDIAAMINARMFCAPVTEAQIANALIRVREACRKR